MYLNHQVWFFSVIVKLIQIGVIATISIGHNDNVQLHTVIM